MSFDQHAIRKMACGGAVARIVVVDAKGSVPRGVGTSMLVTPDAQSGTIGGGALEWEAVKTARQALAEGRDRFDRVPLGPNLGQCCGGAVGLLTEIWDAARLDAHPEDIVARPLPGQTAEMPLAVSRLVSDARSIRALVTARVVSGWMVEPLTRPARSIWIWGAGHVGRALIATLSPLPDLALTWIDTDDARFPHVVPDRVTRLVATRPADLVRHAPVDAQHLILTYSHEIDLSLCHALLSHGFDKTGLIGSATKWARFRTRLGQLGHSPDQIARITCPIGDPALGKHPQAIAIGVGAAILRAGDIGADMEKSA